MLSSVFTKEALFVVFDDCHVTKHRSVLHVLIFPSIIFLLNVLFNFKLFLIVFVIIESSLPDKGFPQRHSTVLYFILAPKMLMGGLSICCSACPDANSWTVSQYSKLFIWRWPHARSGQALIFIGYRIVSSTFVSSLTSRVV